MTQFIKNRFKRATMRTWWEEDHEIHFLGRADKLMRSLCVHSAAELVEKFSLADLYLRKGCGRKTIYELDWLLLQADITLRIGECDVAIMRLAVRNRDERIRERTVDDIESKKNSSL